MLVEFCKRILNKIPANDRNTEITSDMNNSLEVYEEDGRYESFDALFTQDDSMFRHIGALMIFVFNDAKRTTLSGWSWPSRYVTAEMSKNYKLGQAPTSKLC